MSIVQFTPNAPFIYTDAISVNLNNMPSYNISYGNGYALQVSFNNPSAYGTYTPSFTINLANVLKKLPTYAIFYVNIYESRSNVQGTVGIWAGVNFNTASGKSYGVYLISSSIYTTYSQSFIVVLASPGDPIESVTFWVNGTLYSSSQLYMQVTIYSMAFLTGVTSKVYAIAFAPQYNSNTYNLNVPVALNSSGSAWVGYAWINNTCNLSTLNASLLSGTSSLVSLQSLPSGAGGAPGPTSISTSTLTLQLTVQSNGNQCSGYMRVYVATVDPNTYEFLSLTEMNIDVIATPVYPENQSLNQATPGSPFSQVATLDLQPTLAPNAQFVVTPSLNVTSASLGQGSIEVVLSVESNGYSYGYSYAYYGYNINQNFNQTFTLPPGTYSLQATLIINAEGNASVSGYVSLNIQATPILTT